MFLDIINTICFVFVFTIITLFTMLLLDFHIAVIKTSWKFFDIKFFLTYNCSCLIAEYFLYLAYMKYIFN
ncbi:hypothetical protein CK578_07490 [Campylobacter lari]|nr:hypothetical protein [Campylobacter lari]